MNNAKEMAEKGFNTGFTDAEGHELHVGDYVRICNDIGKIVFSCGAFGLYDMTKEERLDAMRNMLKDRPVFVRDGNRADTFIISTKQESLEERRKKVLDKLTAEERKLLGF